MEGIHHATLSDQVMHALQHDIITQHFKAGEKLHISVLKKRYGVGATPIREALSRMAGDALIETQQQRGFKVKPINKEHCQDLFISIQTITAQLITKSIQQQTTKWKQDCHSSWNNLQQQIKQQSQFQFQNWHDLLRNLHITILKQANSPIMLSFEEKLYMQIQRYQHALMARKTITFTPKTKPLQNLLHAIGASDANTAQEYFSQYYLQLSKYLQHRLNNKQQNSDQPCHI